MQPEVKTQRIAIKPTQELRIEIPSASTASLKVIDGTAEIFGTELAKGREYSFKDDMMGIFTWHGCEIEIKAPESVHIYVADETPMESYLQTHGDLEGKRQLASEHADKNGPRVVIVGPVDTGKSSLAKILLGYATRRFRKPLYVDLDVGQGTVTLPGVISALPVTRPVDVEEGMDVASPLAYFFGHASPEKNPKCYKQLVEHLGQVLDRRMMNDTDARISGCIVNTCGWVEGLGYQLLVHTIEALNADVVCVLGHERLYHDLLKDLADIATKRQEAGVPLHQVEVKKLSRSGGVVARSSETRRTARTHRIRQYFYGARDTLCPQPIVVPFADVEIYRIGGVAQAPASALPIGSAPTLSELTPIKVFPERERQTCVCHIMAVSHAKTPEELLSANVAGFVYCKDIDVRGLKLLSPSPGMLPSKFLIVGSLEWLD